MENNCIQNYRDIQFNERQSRGPKRNSGLEGLVQYSKSPEAERLFRNWAWNLLQGLRLRSEPRHESESRLEDVRSGVIYLCDFDSIVFYAAGRSIRHQSHPNYGSILRLRIPSARILMMCPAMKVFLSSLLRVWPGLVLYSHTGTCLIE